MTELAQYYGALMRAELSATAAYRAQIVVGMFGWVVPFVMIALWRGAAGDETIGGISAGKFTTYFVGVLVATTMGLSAAVVFGLGQLIHSGRLSPLLLRPHHPIHVIVARQLAENLTRLPPLLLVAFATIALLDGAVATDPWAWVVAVVLLAVGIVNMVYVAALVGSIALWMRKSAGVAGLIFGFEWVLGGLVAPVVLLPGALTEIARALPLWYAIGAPSELIAGISSVGVGVRALGLGIVWLGILHLALGVVWRRGMVRYESVGT